MAHILAMRFSALGDVAMTVPVLYSYAQAYPDDEVTLLSRKMVAPLLKYAPENVHFMGVDLGDYKGLAGLYRLAKELKGKGFDGVADLHSVMRTWIVGALLRLGGMPVKKIRKGHWEKYRLTRARNKCLVQLKPSHERYRDVFERLGYPFAVHFDTIFRQGEKPVWQDKPKGCRWIGVAPFAAHKGKIYPMQQMKQVVTLLSRVGNIRIFLFGAGKAEGEQCREWADWLSPNVVSMVGKSSMEEELKLMGQLDVMLTMDSANMHLASLVGCKTVSIWGATHPLAGFAGLQAAGSSRIQLDLSCRPCSIFGNKECRLKDSPHKCMHGIHPQEVASKLLEITSK